MFRGCPTLATYPFESQEEAEAIARLLMAGNEDVVECRGAAGELCLYKSADVQAVQVFDEIESIYFQARRKLFREDVQRQAAIAAEGEQSSKRFGFG
jgi:hypothetical protein